MKGIILAGGLSTRLRPVTLAFSKQLLPIYDKPMIYYPLSNLMLAGIREILIICTNDDLKLFQKLLGSGNQYGVKLSYKIQERPDGIAQSFIIAEDFIGDDDVCLILGDNIFYGYDFSSKLEKLSKNLRGGVIFAYHVENPNDFGVVKFSRNYEVEDIIEKPKSYISSYAITGLYFYDKQVVDFAKKLKPSKRGELEISDINKQYLKQKKLKVELLGRGFAWLDTGTYQSIIDAGHFVETIEKRQGLKIACLEEIALNKGWINIAGLKKQAKKYLNSSYGKYLQKLVDERSN